MLISMQNHNEMVKEKPEPENGQNKSDAEAAFFIYLFLFFKIYFSVVVLLRVLDR